MLVSVSAQAIWPARLAVVCICVFLILVVALSVVVVLHPWKNTSLYAAEPDLTVDHNIVVHVNMTTIPERFESDWFAANMRRMMTNMRGKFVWWCNVPPSFGATGRPYVVTEKVKQLMADFGNFKLFHTAQDWGPITKVLGGLYNPDIKLTDCMLICDDDVQYLPDFVQIAAAHYAKDPTRVYTYCGPGVLGFRGYLVQKMMCLALPSNMPSSCCRIDDDLLDMYFQGRTTAITYHGSKTCICTIDGSDWGDWHTEQHTALSRDNRPPMVAACRKDYQLAKQDTLSTTLLALESGTVHNIPCSAVLSDYYPVPAQLSYAGLVAPSELGKIPKIIWRTAADQSWQVNCRSAYDETAQTNPGWEQRVMTNNDVMHYIRTAYASVQPIIDVAERIQLGVMLADLWRLLIIFDQGGLYLDLKCPAVQPIEHRLSLETNRVYVCQWKAYRPQAHLFKGGEFVNWAIMAPPRNPAIWAAICQVVANLQACQVHEDHRFMMLAEHDTGTTIMKSRVLCTTGPIAFTYASLTHPDDIVLVAAELNDTVRYTPPNPSDMLSTRPDHYSRYTRRFLNNVLLDGSHVPFMLHLCKPCAAASQVVLQNISKFVSSNFAVRYYSDDDCANYMAKQDKLGNIGTMYAGLSGADKRAAFKYAVLYEHGGVWLDADAVLMQHLESFVDLSRDLTAVLSTTPELVGLGILACKPGMAIMAQCLAQTLQPRQQANHWHFDLPAAKQTALFFTQQLEAQLSARYSQAKYRLVAGPNQGVRFDFDLLACTNINNQHHVVRDNKLVIQL